MPDQSTAEQRSAAVAARARRREVRARHAHRWHGIFDAVAQGVATEPRRLLLILVACVLCWFVLLPALHLDLSRQESAGSAHAATPTDRTTTPTAATVPGIEDVGAPTPPPAGR